MSISLRLSRLVRSSRSGLPYIWRYTNTAFVRHIRHRSTLSMPMQQYITLIYWLAIILRNALGTKDQTWYSVFLVAERGKLRKDFVRSHPWGGEMGIHTICMGYPTFTQTMSQEKPGQILAKISHILFDLYL